MAREPDVALLLTASGSLAIFLTRLLRMKLFLLFSIYRPQSYQQHDAATEIALTVSSMLLKRKFSIYHCLKLLILLKNAHISW